MAPAVKPPTIAALAMNRVGFMIKPPFVRGWPVDEPIGSRLSRANRLCAVVNTRTRAALAKLCGASAGGNPGDWVTIHHLNGCESIRRSNNPACGN
jgi:hypothetical protein